MLGGAADEQLAEVGDGVGYRREEQPRRFGAEHAVERVHQDLDGVRLDQLAGALGAGALGG
jgi:hypothetical protein